MAWGLEIGCEMLRMCRAGMRRGGVHLHRRAEVAVPPGLIRPSLREGNVTDPAALGELLRDLCKKTGYRGWVRVALPDPIFSLRSITTDELPARREEALRFLRWQARDLLPFPAEEARLDFLPAPSGPDGRSRVTCLMARDRILTEYEQVLAGAGLRAGVLDARSISLALAASRSLGGDTIGLLAITDTRTTLLVIQEGGPRFWRILSEGRRAWAGDALPRLLHEVADSITFCRESEGLGPMKRVALGGLGSSTTDVASALAEWLAIPVTGLDLGPTLSVDGDPDTPFHWGAAIGAAIRTC